MTPKEFYELHQREEFLSKGEIIRMMQLYIDHIAEIKKNNTTENLSQQGEQC